MRLLRHLFATPLLTRARFSQPVLMAVEAAVVTAEQRTSGEIRFAVETALDLHDLWRGETPRQRAEEVFSELGVWNTELRNGVLLYVLMAERDVEIVADRGAAARIPAADWESVCRLMEEHFRAGRFQEGAVAGVSAVGVLLERHFPPVARDRNEQPDQGVLL
jgi:uncharacterized membrane protein YgcG